MINTPNLTDPDAYAGDVLQNAVKFTASLFLGRGKYANAESDTLDGIKAAADKLSADNPKIASKPIIVAFDTNGNQTTVGARQRVNKAKAPRAEGTVKVAGKPIKAGKKAAAAGEPAKPAGKGNGKKAAAPVKAKPEKKPAAPKQLGTRAQAEADAAAGKLPTPPDFSANTHRRYRKKLEELVALIDAGDLKKVKAFPINPYSSSPRAMDRYRNLAVAALEAQAAIKKRAAKNGG